MNHRLANSSFRRLRLMGFAVALMSANLACGFSSDSTTPAWYLHLNGYSHHFKKQPSGGKSVNDFIYGAGAGVRFDRDSSWIWTVSGDVFYDSNYEWSAVAGPSLHYRVTENLNLGGSFYAMYKEDFKRDYGSPVMPAPIPYMEHDFRRFTIRAYFIPPVRKSTDTQVAFQMRIRI